VRWTCPDCGRHFGARNRGHQCEPALTIDAFFTDELKSLRPIYDAVAAHLDGIGDVVVEPVNVGIFFKGRRTFVELRPKRDRRGRMRFELSVIMYRRADHPRVRRVISFSGLYVHLVDLYDAADVDDDVKAWLTESCLSFAPEAPT
jgi:hypothetical protein